MYNIKKSVVLVFIFFARLGFLQAQNNSLSLADYMKKVRANNLDIILSGKNVLCYNFPLLLFSFVYDQLSIVLLTFLEKISHNVPAVYDILRLRTRALRSKDRQPQNVPKFWRGSFRRPSQNGGQGRSIYRLRKQKATGKNNLWVYKRKPIPAQ
jgi:hypothetical protein